MSLFSEKTKELEPYVPGEQPKDGEFIKLNTNENPYAPSKKVIEAIKNANIERLRLYPDPESSLLRETYGKYLGLSEENIFVGNGSDEVLAIAFQTFYMDKENIVMSDIAYSFYPVYCKLYNVTPKIVPLKEDYTIDISSYLQGSNGVVITNPNAPTSLALSISEIEEVVKSNLNGVVLIDEAYIDFGGESVVSLINKYKNLLIVKTLSKSYSLAGLRVGFAIGDKELINGMNRVKNSFNSYPIDMISQIAAIESIKDVEYFDETRNKIMKTRERVSSELRKLGFEVLESKANFLFVMHDKKHGEDVYKYLRENKILVRYFKKTRLDNGLRVTIGTDDEMDKLIKCLENFIRTN